MTRVFGEVAALYDEIRPEYPAELVTSLLEYRGGEFRSVVDVGAGTGKATAALLELGAHVTCVEPDPRMAAVLESKFPQATVVNATFEEWIPPAGGVDLVACATAWHWLDPLSRNQRASDALAPGGVLAVFHHRFGYVDAPVSKAIGDVLQAIDPAVGDRGPHWSLDDVRGSGLFEEVSEREWHRYPVLTTEEYLRLMQTFSPYRRHSEQEQQATLTGLREALARFGDQVTMDLWTLLTLGRRPTSR